jgi:ribosomal protein L37AE/L43A
MKHKVTCMSCGKTEVIEIIDGRLKSEYSWVYFGKINVNSCKTDKFHWRVKDVSKSLLDKHNLEKVPNPCYDSKVKPKMVEMWECPGCYKKVEK